jgi:hypothetical protein
MEPNALIEELQLLPHPEGGFFRETWRSALTLPGAVLPHGAERSAATSIYFLLTAGSFSAFHRIASDDLWFFHSGDPLEVIALPARTGEEVDVWRLSASSPFAVVPAGRTFASRVEAGGRWSLVSCVVAPGFDFADFVMPSRDELVAVHGGHRELITGLTRG